MSPSSGSHRYLKPDALLACVSGSLLVLLALQVARNWGSGGVALARIELLIAIMLLLATAGVERASRSFLNHDRVTVTLLLVGCTIAAAVGNRPGAVASTLLGAFAAGFLIATAFALLAGLRTGRWAAALTGSSIAFAFITAAAWQVAGAPFVARLLVG